MAIAERLARIAQSPALAEGAFAQWCKGHVVVIGGGTLGSRVAIEVVRRGASVLVIDPDYVASTNLGTQCFPAAAVGRSKVAALVAACDAIEPGRARGICTDVRDVGAGVLASSDVLVDCTDDATLAQPLTQLANGLSLPLVRLAVDGTGEREVGRVLVSHGGAGHACQLCPLSARDLGRSTSRTPCPGGDRQRAPTLAGPAALAVVALGLHQVQRLVGGRGRALALDTELVIDLDAAVLHALALTRSEHCLSGHRRWDLVGLRDPVTAITVRDLLGRAGDLLGDDVCLVPHNGPLALETLCRCGGRAPFVGAIWSTSPPCAHCGLPTTWQGHATLVSVNRAQAQELSILDRTLAELGLPEGAAVAATTRQVVVHFVARTTIAPFCESNP